MVATAFERSIERFSYFPDSGKCGCLWGSEVDPSSVGGGGPLHGRDDDAVWNERVRAQVQERHQRRGSWMPSSAHCSTHAQLVPPVPIMFSFSSFPPLPSPTFVFVTPNVTSFSKHNLLVHMRVYVFGSTGRYLGSCLPHCWPLGHGLTLAGQEGDWNECPDNHVQGCCHWCDVSSSSWAPVNLQGKVHIPGASTLLITFDPK